MSTSGQERRHRRPWRTAPEILGVCCSLPAPLHKADKSGKSPGLKHRVLLKNAGNII